QPVVLPVRSEPTSVSTAQLAAAASRVRTALSAPVQLRWRGVQWTISPGMLKLPGRGATTLGIGSAGADRYFARLGRALDRPARNADFAVSSSGEVGIIPSRVGRRLDVAATSANLLAAALSQNQRTARIVVSTARPGRTTRVARAMGIRGLVGSYETIYGGDANRIHNVQLVSRLLDGHLIAPGATFSFNQTTGARTAEK